MKYNISIQSINIYIQNLTWGNVDPKTDVFDPTLSALS